MMQTILLNVLLCLGIIWMLLLIRYTYYYIQFSRREDSKVAKEQNSEAEQKPEEVHTLVGKSKGLSSEDFPILPAVPKPEVADSTIKCKFRVSYRRSNSQGF